MSTEAGRTWWNVEGVSFKRSFTFDLSHWTRKMGAGGGSSPTGGSWAHRRQWRMESFDSRPGMGRSSSGAGWGGSTKGGGGSEEGDMSLVARGGEKIRH
jgi:hypothetical protein